MVINTSNWEWPQWTMMSLSVLSLILCIKDHGKLRPPQNAVVSVISFLISILLLAFGGWFK